MIVTVALVFPEGMTAVYSPSPLHLVEAAAPRSKIANIAREALLDTYAPASVLINARHEALFYFGPIDRYLKVAPGEASRDLFVMARDGLRTKLRAAIRQAGREKGCVALGGGQVDRNGDTVAVSVSSC